VDTVNLDPNVWGSVFPELRGGPESLQTRPILGFRLNQIQDIGTWPRRTVALTSLTAGSYFWRPGKNIASCARRNMRASTHQVPGSGCTCGFYACHDLEELPWPGQLPTGIVAVGVAGTGIVRVHQRGWRAQFARILAISHQAPALNTSGRNNAFLEDQRSWPFNSFSLKTLEPRVARALEDVYRVPVVPLRQLREVMQSAGRFWEEDQ
jgi:hypothetical protein